MSQFYYLNDEILGSCHLAVGERNTVLFDPGMAWYGEKTVEKIKEIIPLYNKVRNYVTQKPYSTEKIKLNFECPTLLNGWDANKEEANLGVILLKEGKYYLGIINPYCKKIFDVDEKDSNEQNNYKKMEYKLLPGPNKMLPKVFFSNSRIEEFNPSKELQEKLKKENINIDIIKADVSKREEVKELIKFTIEKYKKIYSDDHFVIYEVK